MMFQVGLLGEAKPLGDYLIPSVTHHTTHTHIHIQDMEKNSKDRAYTRGLTALRQKDREQWRP